jgi:hypothetical protein
MGRGIVGKKKIYQALLDGATNGLTDSKLSKYVLQQCPKSSSKKIVNAGLLAFDDANLKDRNVLNVICALAIQHRTHSWGKENEGDGQAAPTPKKHKKGEIAAATTVTS